MKFIRYTGVIKTDDVLFSHNFLTLFLFNVDKKHDLGLYLAFKIVSIHSDFF